MRTTMPSPIPPDLAELIADRLRVIGDPDRIRILDLLRKQERTIGELADELATSQQNASKHVGVLQQAGIVGRRKQGTSTYCRVVDASVFDLCELVCGGLQDHVNQLATVMEQTR